MAKPIRKTYRHGNLRAAATEAAYAMVERSGHEALSLRRVAESVGVAHRSLYNHFADKDGLSNAVAEAGFNRLADRTDTCQDKTAFVETYVRFALDNGPIYQLMSSRPHATMKDAPSLQTAVHRVISKALELFGDRDLSSEENRRIVMHIYMLIHGGVTLRQSGILDVPDDERFVADLAEMASAIQQSR